MIREQTTRRGVFGDGCERCGAAIYNGRFCSVACARPDTDKPLSETTIRMGWRWWAWTLAPLLASASAITMSLVGYRIAGVVVAAGVCAWTLLRLAMLRQRINLTAGGVGQ